MEEMKLFQMNTALVKRNIEYDCLVQSRLLLLEESHIEYVLDCLHENTREVKNIKAYLLTCLMNSITTIGNYYQAKVNHDMYGGGI